MSERLEGTGRAGGLAAEDRRLLLALVGVLVLVFALVGSNVAANHAPKPHHVPIGIIGTPPEVRALAGRLERRAPGGYRIHEYSSIAAARTAILHRGLRRIPTRSSPLLLIASAASPSVATLLRQTFAATARAQGQPLLVRDLVPLPSSDSRGGTAFSAVLSLIIAGIMGSAVIYLLGRHRPPPGAPRGDMVALGIGVT